MTLKNLHADLGALLEEADAAVSLRARCEQVVVELDTARRQVSVLHDLIAEKERRISELLSAEEYVAAKLAHTRETLRIIGTFVGWNVPEHPADERDLIVSGVKSLRELLTAAGGAR